MPKQTNHSKVMIALLHSRSIRDAAKASRLSEETLYRYLRDPEFVREYRDARRRSVENAIGVIQQSTTEAAETLQRNLSCENPAVEIRAAQLILETSIKGIEQIDIIERLERLENDNTKTT